jgi:hypothetical protein
MRRYYIVSGIFLILPIIDFAIAAPVLVQGTRQAGADVMRMPEDAMTILGNRGDDDLDKVFLVFEDYFIKPEETSTARPSSPSTVSDAGYELVDAHALPDPGPSTESGHALPVEVYEPILSTQRFSTWFHPDHADYGLMGHATRPNLGPSNPRPSTESDSDHRQAVEEPPSIPASQTEFDADQKNQGAHPPPPSPGSASPTKLDDERDMPDRRSMGADSRLENLQAVGDALKGNVKELRRISGTARDVLNAAQRKSQRERLLNPGE